MAGDPCTEGSPTKISIKLPTAESFTHPSLCDAAVCTPVTFAYNLTKPRHKPPPLRKLERQLIFLRLHTYL